METSTIESFNASNFNDSFGTNETKTQPKVSLGSSTIYITIFLIWVPGILTNALALFFIIRDLRKAVFPAIVLLFVLCLTDLTAVIFSFARHMVLEYLPEATYPICALLSIFHTSFQIYSGVMNSIMAVDRVMAICTPFYYKKHVVVNTWKVVCLIAAIATTFLNMLPLFGLGSYMSIRRGKPYCSSLSFKKEIIERVYGVVYVVVGMLCLVTIVCLNIVVIRSVLKLRNKVIAMAPSETITSTTDTDGKSSKGNQTSYEIAFAKLMVCLAAVYMLCGGPYNVVILLQQLNVKLDRTIVGYIHLISGFSYTVDPVVYILIRKSNRKKIMDFICRCNRDI